MVKGKHQCILLHIHPLLCVHAVVMVTAVMVTAVMVTTAPAPPHPVTTIDSHPQDEMVGGRRRHLPAAAVVNQRLHLVPLAMRCMWASTNWSRLLVKETLPKLNWPNTCLLDRRCVATRRVLYCSYREFTRCTFNFLNLHVQVYMHIFVPRLVES